jgi:hypothetical protein
MKMKKGKWLARHFIGIPIIFDMKFDGDEKGKVVSTTLYR